VGGVSLFSRVWYDIAVLLLRLESSLPTTVGTGRSVGDDADLPAHRTAEQSHRARVEVEPWRKRERIDAFIKKKKEGQGRLRYDTAYENSSAIGSRRIDRRVADQSRRTRLAPLQPLTATLTPSMIGRPTDFVGLRNS